LPDLRSSSFLYLKLKGFVLVETIAFCLPRLGGSELDGRVIAWRKSEGESFLAGDVLLEVETDKAIVEVPVSYDGVLKEQLVHIDQMIEFDQPLAMVDVDAFMVQKGTVDSDQTTAEKVAEVSSQISSIRRGSEGTLFTGTSEIGKVVSGDGQYNTLIARTFASPAARSFAKASGVRIPPSGSGVGGRVVLRDLERIAGASHTEHRRVAATSIAQEHMVSTALGEMFMRSVNISESSSSTTIVLLHGIFGNVDTWAGIFGRLGSAGQAVAAFDLPAHGRSPLPGMSIANMTTALKEAISRLPSGPKVLVGHSLGGAIAALLAQQMPKGSVSSLVLLAPAGLGTEINQGFIDGLLNSGSEIVVRRELAKLANQLPAISDEFLSNLMSKIQSGEKDLRFMARELCQDGVQQIDIRGVLEELPFPVTVFWGRQDQIIPWRHALNAPAKTALHLIAGVGHMPQWECQGLVGDRLLQAALISS
jgi:pyruvate dehydrogenase E2 component (dihydrolipoamide acetyltransferase)